MRLLNLLRTIIRDVWKAYREDDCLILSAAISFYAILSIFPFLLLLFLIWGHWVGSSEVLYTNIVRFAYELVPDVSPDLLEDIRAVVAHRRALGWSGMIFLIMIFDVAFYSIAHAFDRIFGRDRRRRFYKTKLFSFASLLLAALVAYGSAYIAFLAAAIREMGVTVLGFHISLFLSRNISLQTLIYALLLVIFTGIFLIVPHQRVRMRYAVLGGVLFTNLWYLAKIAFHWYVKSIAVFNFVYGTLGTLIVIVLWIFYSSNILLICAEFVSVIQRRWGGPRPDNGPFGNSG